jgi:hypothetical protein
MQMTCPDIPDTISLTEYQRVSAATEAYNAGRTCFLIAVLGTLAFWAGSPWLESQVPWVRDLLGLVAGIGWLALILAVYRLARVVSALPLLWALLVVIPVANIVALLILTAVARRWLRARGVLFRGRGMLGPSPESLEALHERAQVGYE